MKLSTAVVGLFLVAIIGVPASASAHGLVGTRFFPATLTIDDPFVADELSLPTVSHFKTPASGDTPATRETDVSAELSKRLTPDLGFSLGGTWKRLEPTEGPSTSGFDNLEVSLKYVVLKSEAHEALLSLGLGWDVGGTGSQQKVGAEHFDTVTPELFFGKGFGDLPEPVELLKPLALTGAFGFAFPTRGTTVTRTVDAQGNVDTEREANPNVLQWGFGLQYNLQYLSSFVRDIGLPQPFRRMIPLVEFSMQTPTDGRQAGRTTGTVNPGIIWFGRYVQIGIEALLPVNDRTSENVGVIGQLHFYLDDIAPAIFSWTPFHGVLGPTQAR